MKTIIRQGKMIIIHKDRQAWVFYHRKALGRGYKACWMGDGQICMSK